MYKTAFYILNILMALFFLSAHVKAQRAFPVTAVKKITVPDGLSGANVTKIIQDKYGFFWFATQDGLSKFDGKKITVYKKSNSGKHQILGNDIKGIAEDRENDKIWLISAYGGINAIDLKTGTVSNAVTFQVSDTGVKNLGLRKLVLNNGILWMGSYNEFILYDIRKNVLKKAEVPVIPGIKRPANLCIDYIHIDKYENAWIFIRDYGIAVYSCRTLKQTGSVQIRKFEPNAPGKEFLFSCVDETADDHLLVGSTAGVFDISFNASGNGEVKQNSPVSKIKTNDEIFSSCLDEKNTYWYSTINGLYTFNLANGEQGKIADAADSVKNAWFKKCYAINTTKYNQLIVGSYSGVGMYNLDEPPFEPFYQTGFQNKNFLRVFCPFARNDSEVYCACENGIYQVNIKEKTSRTIQLGKSYSTVYEMPDNKIVFSGSSGTIVLNNDLVTELEKNYKELAPLAKEYIKSIAKLNDSVIIFGLDSKGLYKWNFAKRTLEGIKMEGGKHDYQSTIVNKVICARSGGVIVLSDDYILATAPDGTDKRYYQLKNPRSGERIGILLDICETDEHYWIAAYGTGVIQLSKNFEIQKIFTEADGLSNTGVYKLMSGNANTIVVTSNNGISIINGKTNAVKKYFEDDGLHSSFFEEGSMSKFGNNFYAGGEKGFSVIAPEKLLQNARPPVVYINQVSYSTAMNTLNDSFNLTLNRISLPNNVLQTKIFFSGINHKRPGKIEFRYRIAEINSDWIDNGDQDFVTLIGLSPGTYHLQVKAANEDGVWSEPKELILEFLPKWYQTWWFKMLVFLATAGIIYAFYRYRIAQIKKQHEIRKNIATDLHDDLGSTLNSVKVFTNLAISGVKQEESLQQIKDNLNEATMGLRDMIWVLDDSLDTVDELVTRLKQFAIPVASASNIQADIKAATEVNGQKLTKEEKRNLFLVCKEAINNSIKYSGATQINVEIKPAGKKIQISITDNGKGFNVEEVKKGYGLKNMQYRAGQVKYKTSLLSSPGNGTQVEIRPV